MALITAENISLAYDGNVVAKNLNFTVNSGDYLAIVGENGSGKSTLMKSLLGLIKVGGGKIEFGEGLKSTEIGYLPQMTSIQKDFPASCMEVVLSGTSGLGKFKPFYTKKDKALAMKNLELMGSTHLKNKSFQDLSGGQQQRILLARALCATQKLLILDEPVTGLDPVVTQTLYELISDLNKKHGITVVMVSHDIGGALDSATHILHMKSDKAFFGTKEEYLKSDISTGFMGGISK